MQISLFHDKNKFEEAITEQLLKGSNFQGSKDRIKKFFKSNSSKDERVSFLKKEYGVGGSAGTYLRAYHDSKGKKITLNIKGELVTKPYTWWEIEERIDRLIRRKMY